MVRREWEIRGIPLWLLREYLHELGGVIVDDGSVQGSGWTAQLTQMEDFQVQSLRVGQVRLELQAGEEAYQKITPALEKKLLRAGG